MRVPGGNVKKGKSTNKSNTVPVGVEGEDESEEMSEDEIRVIPSNPANKNTE